MLTQTTNGETSRKPHLLHQLFTQQGIPSTGSRVLVLSSDHVLKTEVLGYPNWGSSAFNSWSATTLLGGACNHSLQVLECYVISKLSASYVCTSVCLFIVHRVQGEGMKKASLKSLVWIMTFYPAQVNSLYRSRGEMTGRSEISAITTLRT